MSNADRVWILLGKKKTGEASREELSELAELIKQQGQSGQAAEVVDKVWDTPLVSNPELRPTGKVWEKLEKQIAQPELHRVVRMSAARWMVAASVLVLAGLAYLWFKNHGTYSTPARIAGKTSNQYSTQPGSKSKLELPDGTQVWLNGNSKLSVASEGFGSVSREVYLSGEAYFDVARNENLPFLIHTRSIDITVLGTAFNVKAYPGEKNIETSLVRGLIAIANHNDPDRKILLKPNEKIIIPADTMQAGGRDNLTGIRDNALASPGGQGALPTPPPATYAITALHKSPSGIVSETIWMQRKLEFDNEPFTELASKMEAWFDIRIKFGSEAIKSRRFSGVIEKETLEETLKDLQLTTPFKYTINRNELIIN